jgi:GDPmannose 4,6-dehydratase
MANGAIRGFITRAFSHVGPGRPNRYAYSSDAYQIAKIIKGKQEPVLQVGNVNAQRNVMDVRDVADVYYKLMLKNIKGEMPQGEVFNICGNKVRRYEEYIDMMLSLVPRNIKVKLKISDKLWRKVDILVQNPDSTKVREYLDWEPTISINKTMSDLVDYWLEKV